MCLGAFWLLSDFIKHSYNYYFELFGIESLFLEPCIVGLVLLRGIILSWFFLKKNVFCISALGLDHLGSGFMHSSCFFCFFIENNVSRQYTMIQLKYLHRSERTRLRCSLSPGGRGLCSAVKPSIHVLRMLIESPNITLRFEHQLNMQPQSSLTSIKTRIAPHYWGH